MVSSTVWRSIGALALVTAAPADSARPPRPIGILLVAGDIAKCNPKGARDEATAAVLARVVAEAKKRRVPVRVIALGDLAYERGTAKEFECFDRSWGAFKPIMLPVPGNHEYGVNGAGPAEGYFSYFRDAPLVAGKPLVEVNGERTGYYSVNFPSSRRGPWQLIGLNAYLKGPERQRQMEWLREELRTSRSRCVIGFWHPYVLSSGKHGHEDGDSDAPVINTKMLDAFKILHEARATAVLAGHDHNFEQFSPHDAEGNAVEGGVRTFVVGTGGAALRKSGQESRWPSSEAYDETTNGVLRIDLYKDRYSWSFLPIDGQSAPALATTQQSCNGPR